MKIRLLALTAGLTLLLSACLPDLPDPVGTVDVTVAPAEAARQSMDWTLSGTASFSTEEITHEGTCDTDCDQFQVDRVQRGDWEFRMTPPEFNPLESNFGWVGTGAAAEVTADYIETFELESQTTHNVEANFRWANALEWAYSTTNAPATVTLTDVVTTGVDNEFELAGVTLTCSPRGSVNELEFVLPAGTNVSVNDTPQTITLDYDGSLSSPNFGTDPNCSIREAWDTDNRPVATAFSSS